METAKRASRNFRVRVRAKVYGFRLNDELVKDVRRIGVERDMNQRQALEDALADWIAKWRHLLKNRG